MALPTTISVIFPDQNYCCGPWLAPNGNVYLIGRNSSSTNSLSMQKATDPTSSFSEASNTGTTTTLASAWGVPSGTDIYALHRYSTSLSFTIFNTSTDAWGTTTSVGSSLGSNNACCSLALRSSDQIGLYGGATESVMGTSYDRVVFKKRASGTWDTNATAVSATNVQAHHRGAVAVIGASDRVHFFWSDVTNTDAIHRSLDSSNTLDTASAYDAASSGLNFIHSPGVSYVSGANTEVRVPYRDNLSSDPESLASLTSGANPSITVVTGVTDTNARSVNNTSVLSMSLDGTDLYVLYADATSSDLFLAQNVGGAGWGGTDTSVLTGTLNRSSSSVYTRSGSKVIAHIYDDGGTVKYDEIALTVSADPLVHPPEIERVFNVYRM